MSAQASAPQAWKPLQDGLFRRFAGITLLAVLVPLWGFQFVIAVIEHRYLYAAFYLPAALGWAALCSTPVILHRLRTRSNSAPHDVARTAGGIVIPTSRAYRGATTLSHILAVVAGVILAYGMWTGRLSFPMTNGQSIVFPLVGAALATAAASVILCFLGGSARWPSVEVDPHRLTVVNFRSRQVIDWSQVSGIEPILWGKHAAIMVRLADHARADVDVFYRGPWAPDSTQLECQAIISADLMASGAAPLLAFLQFYADHPDLRDDLADVAGIRKLIEPR